MRSARRLHRNFVAPLVAFVLCGTVVAATAPTVSRQTRHLAFKAILSSDVVKPGSDLVLHVDVTPKMGMHVYAPGTQYRAVAVTLDPATWLTSSAPVYPTPERYLFKPLNEEVLVYSKPFQVSVNIQVGTTLPTTSTLKVMGAVTYQACDDRVCYLPQTVPVEWTVNVAGTLGD